MFIPMRKKKKKAVSEIIGYILLITFAIVIAGVVYSWLKTYVPKEGIACPDEVSIYISDYNFDEASKELDLTLKNNGQFSIGGIFIYYSTNETQEIAVNDLSKSPLIETEAVKMTSSGGGLRFGTATSQDNLNLFEPGDDKEIIFDVANLRDTKDVPVDYIYAVEIIPIRWQSEGTKKPAPVSCANAKTKKILNLDMREIDYTQNE